MTPHVLLSPEAHRAYHRRATKRTYYRKRDAKMTGEQQEAMRWIERMRGR